MFITSSFFSGNQFSVLKSDDDEDSDDEDEDDAEAGCDDFLDDYDEEDLYDDVEEGDLINIEFRIHKRDYYMTKLEYKAVTP